jgi:hypothetical protein
VLSGKLPYHYCTTDKQLFQAVVKQGKWPKRDEKILDSHWKLIFDCWKKEPSQRPKMQTVVEEIEEFCKKREHDKLECPFAVNDSKEVANPHPHTYPSFDPDTFTPHVILLLEFPKGTMHMDLVAFIHRQHFRDCQQSGSNTEHRAPLGSQKADDCTRCPTSLFVTCKSKAYATYKSDELLHMAILECSGKTWNELDGSKVICKGYAPEGGKDTLKHERGSGFFIRWKSLVPFNVPHRRRRVFLMRSRNPEVRNCIELLHISHLTYQCLVRASVEWSAMVHPTT